MEMNQSSNRMNPLMAGAAVSVMLVSLLGGRASRRVTWPVVRDHWDADVTKLEALLKARMVGGIAQLTPEDLSTEADAFLRAKETSDVHEVTTQALERLRLDTASARRLSSELASVLK